MFYINTPTEDEIKYFNELKYDSSETNFLNYIGKVEKITSDSIEYSESNHTTNHKITANIATQPSRFENLLQTLESIDGQFDEIRIYLNQFNSIPDELKKYTTHIGKNLTDNGKFFWSNNENEFYFTLDDDIIYPKDYVKKTLPLIKDRVVTYHGRILTGKNKNYYDSHLVYLYYSYLKEEKVVDVGGTGVMAFDTNIFSPNLWKTPNYKMTDLVISLEAHLNNIPIVTLPKSGHWITYEDMSLDGIYWEFKGKEENQIKFADMIQTYNNSKIDSSKLNYSFSKESVLKLSELINQKNESGKLIILRSGNGELSENLSTLILNKIYSYDSSKRRILYIEEKFPESIVNYLYIESIEEFSTRESSFIFLDDIMLSSNLSTKIYNSLSKDSVLICSKIVDGIFPDSKIELSTIDKDTLFYIYLKK